MSYKKQLESLREALQYSPDNLPLRKHIIELLLENGEAAEAEKELRIAIESAAEDNDLKISLAKAFYQQNKHEQSLVILEDLVNKGVNLTSADQSLYARLLLKSGQKSEALSAYQQAQSSDPSFTDDFLEEEFRSQREPVMETETNMGNHIDIEKPEINFENVGGMEDVKEQIRLKIIHPLKHPELYESYGKKAGGGILLYGPPGCGKTHIARATAGEINAKFISVELHDILDMWIGESEKNLHAIFENARRNTPCVLFFDEVDALGSKRSNTPGTSTKLINQFLSELDGINSQNDGILVLAATNMPWNMDPAFRRPGRFDRMIFVHPPDTTARAAILKILLQDKPIESIDYDMISQRTNHFSGADLKGIIDQAIELKLQDAMKEGTPKPITTKDLKGLLNKVNPTTTEWFETARNYAMYSNQGGHYDEILKYLKK